MSRSVSVIIPNYNGKHLLQEYLPSVLAALKHSNIDHEIIISDDASSDDSIQFLTLNYPQVKIVRSELNRGFSHAVNNGLKLAQKELVLLLNSDVRIKENYFESQWKYFDKADTFGVMGSIWTEDGKRLMDAAKYPIWKGGQLKTTVNYKLKHKSSAPCLTLFLSGANALVNREKLLKLQGMDERYSPYYMEDVDLSIRAWRMGWKCYYEADAMCYHKLSETISNHNTQRKVKHISKRNKFVFHDTHLEGAKRLLWNIENILNLSCRWILFDLDYYRAYSACTHIPKTENTFPVSLENVTDQILEASKRSEKELF